MICKKTILRISAAMMLGVSMVALAEDSTSKQPGFVDFGDLSAISDNAPAVEISLGGALLRFLAIAIANEDQELADTIGKLKSIRISVFELQPEDLADATARAIAISKQLGKNIISKRNAYSFITAAAIQKFCNFILKFLLRIDSRHLNIYFSLGRNLVITVNTDNFFNKINLPH